MLPVNVLSGFLGAGNAMFDAYLLPYEKMRKGKIGWEAKKAA